MEETRIRFCRWTDNIAPFQQFCKRLPEEFDHVGREIHHGRNILKVVEANSLGLDDVTRLMVKRYHGLFFFQRIYYSFFRAPKCRRAFDNTAELRRRGIDAARQLAVIELWQHGLFKYGMFVSEAVQGERLDDLVIRLQKEGGRQDTIEAIIRAFASFVCQVHRAGVVYMDMNCGNVICRQEQGRWHFTLVDTNRAKFYEASVLPDLETCMPDLILMNPVLGLNDLFQASYLKERGICDSVHLKSLQEAYLRRNPPHSNQSVPDKMKELYYHWLES